MNLTSFLANKCFEYLLNCGSEKTGESRFASGFGASSPPIPSPRTILPPWAGDNSFFYSNCDGCGVCIQNCENGILVAGPQGYPQVDFSRGACSFCGACARSCPGEALCPEGKVTPWVLKASITATCLARGNVLCRTCVEHCGEGAIIMSKTNGAIAVPRIQAEKCSGCGACYSPCPVRAIDIASTTGSEK